MANLIMIRSGDDITLTNQILSPRATTNFPTAVAVLEPTSEAVDEQFTQFGIETKAIVHRLA